MRIASAGVIGKPLELSGVSIGATVHVRFGAFTLDTDTRQVFGAEGEIHLSPKAYELLKILVENRPRALAKNELHERLWPATFVSEVNLATLIAEIREALGDDARKPRFVRTAHRFGYAFCGMTVDGPRTDPSETTFCWLVKDGRRLPLRPGENVLGREPDDGINLDSPTVSRRHARIMISATGVTLEDLDSKNGTFLKGQRVASAVPLTNGDEIRVGSVVLRFRMTPPKGLTSTWTEGVAKYE
jgi:DNA-binding winged helix-turn-helix (wHTH) protein